MPEPETERYRSRLFIFGVGASLMLVWPLLGTILQQPARPMMMLLYLIGAFVMLFDDGVQGLIDYLMKRFDNQTVVEIVAWTIVGTMILTWFVILCLPLFGQWKRHRLVLWLTQSSYAAAQTLCGYFFLKQQLP